MNLSASGSCAVWGSYQLCRATSDCILGGVFCNDVKDFQQLVKESASKGKNFIEKLCLL